MRFVFSIITSAMVMGLLIGCSQADDHEEVGRPSTMPASSNLHTPTTTISIDMKMSVVKTKIRFAGGRSCIISQLIHPHPQTPGKRWTPDLYILKGNILVYTVSTGPVGAPSGEYTLAYIKVGKLKSYDAKREHFKWLSSAGEQHMMELADEVTLSKEGLVAFVPYDGAKSRLASELRAFSPSDVE